tara:strand:- start:405 stop:1205 length:801 start_codon:yes stop_codon:yes gene_type:complete
MGQKKIIIIFTDLDGTFLNTNTFKFGNNKKITKKIIKKGIIIIPNSSKTIKELESFNKSLNIKIPFISENGSCVNNLKFISQKLPFKIEISRPKKKILKIFNKYIEKKYRNKCVFINNLSSKEQSKVLGLKKMNLNNALNRKYTVPIKFIGTINEKIKLQNKVKKIGLSFQEGGRIINIGDNTNKGIAMKKLLALIKKKLKVRINTIGIGDNYNDLEMLKNSDIPCMVRNKKFNKKKINLSKCIFSKKEAPYGWAEVVKLALEKVN